MAQKISRQNSRLNPIQPKTWDKKRFISLLHSLDQSAQRAKTRKKILVIGDVGVDRYTLGSVERISPEAPVPIVLVQEEQHKLGLAANVADNIRALGGVPWLVGVVGRDRGAQDFRDLLKKGGISSTYLVPDGERRTVLKERVVSERQQLLRIDYESTHSISEKTGARILAQVQRLLPKADAVILEDYGKGLVGADLVTSIFSLTRKNGKIVTVDPNTKTTVDFYLGATVLTPNTREAEAMTGIKIHDDASLIEVGEKILACTQARNVVITRGKEGMAIFSAGTREVSLIPTYAREVYDVSGAGDTVISVLTLALTGGATIEEAAILGNLAAGVEVGKRGTATVSLQEIAAALEFYFTQG